MNTALGCWEGEGWGGGWVVGVIIYWSQSVVSDNDPAT